ncbi:MAG: prephenate dehydrogenase, partial [Candidatus Methylomirabilales bacterium]
VTSDLGPRTSDSASRPLGRLAVVGLGLIGGSLALAAREAKVVDAILGVERDPAHREAAGRLGLADRVGADLRLLAEADLVVLAVPVCGISALLPEVARAVPPHAVVTDVGSVKAAIQAAGEAAFPDGRFVAGHPIAGRERSGPEAARADLFAGATCILTPTAATRPAARAAVDALWQAAGCRVRCMEAGWHDQVFAAVSHLPHLVAYALMDAVLGMERGAERIAFSAGGLRDFTRVAASHPEMWRDIFCMNREPLLRAVAAYRQALDGLEAAIRAGDGEAILRRLARARLAREEIPPSPATR